MFWFSLHFGFPLLWLRDKLLLSLMLMHLSELPFLEFRFLRGSYFSNIGSLSTTSALLLPLKTGKLFLDKSLPCSLPEFEDSVDICLDVFLKPQLVWWKTLFELNYCGVWLVIVHFCSGNPELFPAVNLKSLTLSWFLDWETLSHLQVSTKISSDLLQN